MAEIDEAASGRPTPVPTAEGGASNQTLAVVALENTLPLLLPLELLHAAVPPPGAAPTATVLDAKEIGVPVVGAGPARFLLS